MQSQPDSPPSLAPGEPQQDPELWFKDGNVVVVAGNAAFSIHTGVLSRHSEIFQDMFEVPQPALPAPLDVFDGKPVVHVSDSAHDFKQLLHMLYDGTRFMPPDKPVAFGVIAAVARLGHKYQIEWVLEEAKRRLRSIFRPSSFDEWLKQGSRSGLCDRIPPSSWIEALNLIQVIGETDMLPLAVYQACQFGSVLFKGTRRADGREETLDPPMLERCYNTHARLIQRQSALNADIFCTGPSGLCQREKECRRTTLEIYLKEVCQEPSDFLTGNPIEEGNIFYMLVSTEEDHDLCKPCATALMEREKDGRRKIWKDLRALRMSR